MNTTVLVVDDEPAQLKLLRRWLEGWGYVVETAENADDALDVLQAQPASIAVVDVRMPGHDGFWLVDQIHAKWPNTAIVMATADSEIATVEKSKCAGVVDYVVKPFGREMLRQALDRAESAR